MSDNNSLENSVPFSCWIILGTPEIAIMSTKCIAIVAAFLSGKARNTTYLENRFTSTRQKLFPLADVQPKLLKSIP